MDADKLSLLKSLKLFEKVPEPQLAELSQFLKPLSFQDSGLIFEENSPGDNLFFVAGGQVRISKTMADGKKKDLALLRVGDCFGEMAVFSPSTRSARASASGPTLLLSLGKQDLDAWLKDHPSLAIGFFAELVQVQSARLRRTSSELSLLFDLSLLLLESQAGAKELLAQALTRMLPHLPEEWACASYLYNSFNKEIELVSTIGNFDFKTETMKAPLDQPEPRWISSDCYFAPLVAHSGLLGYLLFHPPSALPSEDRSDQARTLQAAARLLANAVENANFRTEDSMRTRLKTQAYGSFL